jgi:hypothetical protein
MKILPLSIELGPGNEHDSKKFNELLNENIRNNLECINIKANIPINPRNGRKPKTI